MTTHAARFRALAVLDSLCDRYPQTFAPLDAVPRLLAIGVRELVQAENPDIPVADLRRALSLYCVRAAYRRVMFPGAELVDLHGAVVAVVTADEIERIAVARRAARAERKAAGAAEQVQDLPPEFDPPLIVGPAPPKFSLPNGKRPVLSLKRPPPAAVVDLKFRLAMGLVR